MEGTRHEKVGIAVAAYVIGFTTAFISFGVTKIETPEQKMEVIAVNQQVQETVEEISEPLFIGELITNNEGFFVKIGEYEKLLSSKVSSQTASAASSEGIAGYHAAVHGAGVSSDAKFAYFCEQLLETDESCVPYVYSIDADTLFRVIQDGENMSVLNTEAIATWDAAGLLHFDTAVSVNANEPWVVVSTGEVAAVEEDTVVEETEDTVQIDEPVLQ